MDAAYWADKLVIHNALYILDKSDTRNKKYLDAETPYIDGYIYTIYVLKSCPADYVIDCQYFPHVAHMYFTRKFKFDGKIINWPNDDIIFTNSIPFAIPKNEIFISLMYGKPTYIVSASLVA